MVSIPEAIYLDHNGSAPVAPEAIAAMRPWFDRCIGNPASNHVFGRHGKTAIETARQQVATMIGCRDTEVVFTSGGTESNNLALKGVADSRGSGHILTAAIEHPSILKVCRYLEGRGFATSIASVDSTGRVDTEEMISLLRPDTILVTLMLANNEVGTFQPVREIASAARKRGVLVHCDAAQVVGKERVNIQELGVDLLTIAGHKLNAPKGVGALYVREGVEIVPQLHGSGHENGKRSGTQDVLEIVGLGAAAARVTDKLDDITLQYRTLRDFFEATLFESIPSAILNGPKEQRLVNTTNVAFPGIKSGALLEACPEIACAPGAACHKDHSSPSHVLSAMGLSKDLIESSVRFSLGFGTTREELERAVFILKRALEKAVR